MILQARNSAIAPAHRPAKVMSGRKWRAAGYTWPCETDLSGMASTETGLILSIWNDEQPLDAPTQPTQAVASIIIWDGVLYCGHASASYVTAYKLPPWLLPLAEYARKATEASVTLPDTTDTEDK